jgi:nucleoside-diphosphate-sugar epimerase
MSKIVILGGAGMLGLALAKRLSQGDTEIVIIDDYSRPVEFEQRFEEAQKYSSAWPFEIRDDEFRVESLMEKISGADVVINAAADVGGVFYNRDSGPLIFSRNARLQSVPVYATMFSGIETFVQISSVCVYAPSMGYPGSAPSVKPHEETDPLGQLSADNGPYALAKRAGETLALSSNIENVIVVRPTNMYGPWDHYDAKAHVIPALIKKALLYDEVDVYSDPRVERDFLYVGQAADWIARLINLDPQVTNRQIFNLPMSSGGRLTIGELVRSIISHADAEDKPLNFRCHDGPTEVYRRISGQKLRDALVRDGLPLYNGLGWDDMLKNTMAAARRELEYA